MRISRLRLLGIGAVAALALSACGGQSYDTVAQKASEAGELVIGVKYDQPALGLKSGDSVEGFDVDVAKYIAKELGVDEANIEWKEARSENRESFLQRGEVDMVVATYSILPERKKQVTFAGPYYVAHQDVMVRADDASITNPDDLAGKRICQAAGSNSYKRITDDLGIEVKLVPTDNYSSCLTKLKSGALDSVTTDDLILAGFAAQEEGKYKILGQPFTDEKYGVGLPKGDVETCEAVNKALEKMYSDGTAAKLLEKWFGPTNLQYSTELPQFEGCS